MTRSRHEWLGLVEVSGPFLAAPVLDDVFPQGLDALEHGKPQRLRSAYEEWREAVDVDDPALDALHAAWIDEVLATALNLTPDVLRRGSEILASLNVTLPAHGVTFGPDLVVVEPGSDAALLAIHVFAPDVDLDATRRFDGLATTPKDRMVALLRAIGCPLGLVTNGERWLLVHVPTNGVTGFASWYARLWAQEPDTLRAFASLLEIRRFLGDSQTKLPKLYERSLSHQDRVTDALGDQVRRAVEVLVQALDRADQDRNRELLRDVDPRTLYEAGLTVMMRLVFMLAAEERGLLLLGEERYDRFYALSTLRMQLRSDSEEILERRRSAWSRLLALFRAVYGGIEHPALRLPALGGSLFDPDRYAFLEGRANDTSWQTHSAEPLPIDDRTVLLLLESIQTLEGRTLSYRALDVEQIGHVYEGLLERTIIRVEHVTLELEATAGAGNPTVGLGELDSARLDGVAKVVALIKDRSGRSESAIRNGISRTVSDGLAARLLTVCRGDVSLRDRILPYASLLRLDPWNYPLVRYPGSFVVTLGSDRRDTGTHYTPKSLTEKIVRETLTPLAYVGPSEGRPESEWRLKTAEHLLNLKICDPAMGSGAFLVAACRWLSDRLVEAWSIHEDSGGHVDAEGLVMGESSTALLSTSLEERSTIARRLIAENCLYGVDQNPLAVELAKLSLWLTTISRGRPFGFLDHKLQHGNSLLGIERLNQLLELSLEPKANPQLRLFGRSIQSSVDRALELRSRLRSIQIRDINDVMAMAALNGQAKAEIDLPERISDFLCGIFLVSDRSSERSAKIASLASLADDAVSGSTNTDKIDKHAKLMLSRDVENSKARKPFHWPLVFPEVFVRSNPGFDAFVGNPPFMGGRQITGSLGQAFYRWLDTIRGNSKGSPDLVVFFFLRVASLLRPGGTFGLIATSTIADTGNRAVGLASLLRRQYSIYHATTRMPWPGKANVEVSIIVAINGSWAGTATLNNEKVASIAASLTTETAISPNPLPHLRELRSDGFKFMGEGFVLSEKERSEIIDANPDEAEVIFPYFTGDDLASMPDTDIPPRYAIDFEERTLNSAQLFCASFSRVERLVKPIRDRQSGQIHQTDFWKYWDMRPKLRAIQAQGEVYLVCPSTTKYIFFRRFKGRTVLSQKVKVIFLPGWGDFTYLQSSMHNEWARATSGTRGASSVEYSLGKAFGTFPRPDHSSAFTNVLGEKYYDLRELICKNRNVGPTDFYNLVHSPSCHDGDIVDFRSVIVAMEAAVFREYGWGDINADFAFRSVDYLASSDRTRFTLDPKTISILLQRLMLLNTSRWAHDAMPASLLFDGH